MKENETNYPLAFYQDWELFIQQYIPKRKIEKKLAAPKIDFADSELRSFSMDQNNPLIILLNSWDDRTITMEFSNVIYCSYKGGFQLEDFYEVIGSALFDEVISKHQGNGDSFKFFLIESIYDTPIMEIIAQDVKVIKGSDIREDDTIKKSDIKNLTNKIPEIDFSSATLKFFEFEENNDFFVYLKIEDRQELKISFYSINYFVYRAGNKIANFRDVSDHPILIEKLEKRKKERLSKMDYHYLQLEDSSQNPIIEIMTELFAVEKINSENFLV